VRTKRSAIAIAFALAASTGVFTIRNPLAAEDRVEQAAVFAVAVANQEPDAPARQVEAEVARTSRSVSNCGSCESRTPRH
jgi:hypothetical protein